MEQFFSSKGYCVMDNLHEVDIKIGGVQYVDPFGYKFANTSNGV